MAIRRRPEDDNFSPPTPYPELMVQLAAESGAGKRLRSWNRPQMEHPENLGVFHISSDTPERSIVRGSSAPPLEHTATLAIGIWCCTYCVIHMPAL